MMTPMNRFRVKNDPKMIKMTKYNEALQAAQELDVDLGRFYGTFCREMVKILDAERERIAGQYNEWYQKAAGADDYLPEVQKENLTVTALPLIEKELLQIKEEHYEEKNYNFFRIFNNIYHST